MSEPASPTPPSLSFCGDPTIQGCKRSCERSWLRKRIFAARTQRSSQRTSRLFRGSQLIIRGRILEYGLKPSRPAASVVQMRLYAQDAKTGELIWSNRAEVEVAMDRHGWRDENDLKALFDRATRELIDALMADFFGER